LCVQLRDIGHGDLPSFSPCPARSPAVRRC
jgi:hypothetical protein